jgi:hypothetical protein
MFARSTSPDHGREEVGMRVLMAAIAMALLTSAAQAQGMGRFGSHKNDVQKTQKTEDPKKKKADEKAYKDALKKIPDANAPVDPWKGMR